MRKPKRKWGWLARDKKAEPGYDLWAFASEPWNDSGTWWPGEGLSNDCMRVSPSWVRRKLGRDLKPGERVDIEKDRVNRAVACIRRMTRCVKEAKA